MARVFQAAESGSRLAEWAGVEPSLAQLEAVFHTMSEALTVVSPAGEILMTNRAALALHGYKSFAELGSRHVRDYPSAYGAFDLTGRELPFEEWPVSRALRGESFTGQELRVLHKENSREWIGSYGGAQVWEADGRLACVIVTMRNITEQKRDEEALRRAEQEYRALAENTPAMYARFDRSLRHLYVNRQVELTTGIPRARYLGKTNEELGVPEELRAGGDERMRGVFETGQSVTMDFTFPSPSGPRYFHAWFGPEFSSSGMVETVICITQDVTEQKELENELRRRMDELASADHRKDEFLATLAHELRNPLAPLRHGLEVLRLRGEDPALAARARTMMERQLSHLVRLVDDLLDVSRITRGMLQLRKERIALSTAVDSAVETTAPAMAARRHRLHVSLPHDPVYLYADPVRLSQIVSNLLANAAKYTDDGGTIRLSAERERMQVVIRVRDNGIGIPREHLPYVFEMFSQVTPIRERAQGGLGIGLSLVRALVELHGGKVEASSEGSGAGSEFTVTLATAGDATNNDGSSSDPSLPKRKRRILVVDDNIDAAESLSIMLELLGHEVRTAHDGVAALAQAEKCRPDVVLLDIGLPRMNGYDVARAIRAQAWGASMVLVALTGWGQDEEQAGRDGGGLQLPPHQAGGTERTRALARRARTVAAVPRAPACRAKAALRRLRRARS